MSEVKQCQNINCQGEAVNGLSVHVILCIASGAPFDVKCKFVILISCQYLW